MFLKLALAMIAVLLGAACPNPLPAPDGCNPRDWICRNDTPYVCSGSQRWTAVSKPCHEFGAECRIVPSVYDRRPIAACVSPRHDTDGGTP